MKQLELLRCVPFVLIFDVAEMDEKYPSQVFLQYIFDLFLTRYDKMMMIMMMMKLMMMYDDDVRCIIKMWRGCDENDHDEDV